jgi:peptide/nickel transport system substrate-binding protein
MTADKPKILRYAPTRREFLRDSTLVTVGIIAAACQPGTSTPTAGGGGKKGGEFHGAWPYDLPPKGHYNYFAPSGAILQNSFLYMDFHMPWLAMWRWGDAKWEYFLAESSKFNGNVFEVKLRPNIKWSDGKAFSSKDVVTTFQIGRAEGFTAWNYLDKVEAAGDLQVNFTFKTLTTLGERAILRGGYIRPDSLYADFAKRVTDLFAQGKAVGSDEIKAVRAEYANLRPEPVASGPYKIDKSSVTEAQMTLVRNTGGLFADKVNFDKIVIYNGETTQVTPLVIAGNVDYATHGFPVATEKGFTDAGLRILRAPAFSGPALVFQWNKAPAFQDKRVRQAVAYALNREDAARAAFNAPTQQKFMAGFVDELVPQYISDADQKKLNAYANDKTKADQLMQAAGYARGSDGIWAKDGKKIEYDLYFPSDFADWSPAADVVQKQLNAWGMKITPRGAQRSQQLPDVENGNFQLAIMGWSVAAPHPQAAFVQDLRTHNTVPAKGGYQFPMKQKTDAYGDIDFDQLITQTAEGNDLNKQKETITKFAIAFNELLPIIPLAERYGNNPVNEKRIAGWKPDGDPVYKNPFGVESFVTLLIFDGSLSAK